MSVEQGPTWPDQHSEQTRALPEGILVSPNLTEEFRKRMKEANTDDWQSVLEADLRQRYRALRTAYPSDKDFNAKREDNSRQGERWALQRMIIGLTHDQVAEQIGVSSWELVLIEAGFPSPEGVSDNVFARMDKILSIE